MQKEWSQGVVEANGLRIAYHRAGSGGEKPPLLLLHGYTDSARVWARMAHDLEDQYDVIFPDARGHGQTAGPVSNMNIDLLARDAAALLRALGLGQSFLYGHSMGAMTALAVAVNEPDRVRAAVLEDPPFRLPDPYVTSPEEAQELQQMARDDLAFQQRTLEERLAQGRAEHPHWAEEEIQPWAQSKGEFNPEIIAHRTAFRSYPWRKALPRVTRPLLLITGSTENGAIVLPALARQAASLCSTCQVVQIEGAGHSIHRDRYAETLRVVRDFLNQH